MRGAVLTALGFGRNFFHGRRRYGRPRDNVKRATWSSLVLGAALAVLLGFPAGPVEAQTDVSVVLVLRTECTEVTSFETATVRALLAVDGTGIAGARLSVRSSGGGELTSAVDLGDGRYEFSWTAPRVGPQTYVALYVHARSDAYGNASSRIVFLVDPYTPTSTNPGQLFMMASPAARTLRPGGTVDVGVFVFTIEGFIISGVTISATVRDPSFGTLGAPSRRGCGYAFTFTASSSITVDTSVLIIISVEKFAYAIATTRIGLTIIV